MIKTAPTKTAGPMNKAEAQAITERIRKHIDAAWADITRAYEGKAWKALGYETWEAYVRAEFDMGRSRSYQLIDQGRVIQAIAEATGGDVHHGGQISERDVREIKAKLPEIKEEIKSRVEHGQKPNEAAVAAVKAAKEKAKAEKAAKQAENDRQRDEVRSALPPQIKAAEEARANAKAAKKAEPSISVEERIAELEESVRALEAENATLKAENKLFAEMKAEWEKGGFEEVIRGKDEVIRAQLTRIERESADKVSWKRAADMWRKRAEEAGYSNNAVIDIETGEIIHHA